MSKALKAATEANDPDAMVLMSNFPTTRPGHSTAFSPSAPSGVMPARPPKLPDDAIIDVTGPATAVAPGGVVAAGFFDETWAVK